MTDIATAADHEAVRPASVWMPLVELAEIVQAAPIPVRVMAGGSPWALVILDGEVRALYDVCPHRRVPLSAGKVAPGPGGEVLECGYHGWSYDTNGACARIPALGENVVPRGMGSVRVLRTAVMAGLVWGADEDAPALPALPSGEIFLRRQSVSASVAGIADRLAASVVPGDALLRGVDDLGAFGFAARVDGDSRTEIFPAVTDDGLPEQVAAWVERLTRLPLAAPQRPLSDDFPLNSQTPDPRKGR